MCVVISGRPFPGDVKQLKELLTQQNQNIKRLENELESEKGKRSLLVSEFNLFKGQLKQCDCLGEQDPSTEADAHQNLQNSNVKATVLQNKIDNLEQYVAENFVSVQSMNKLFESQRKAFGIEKSSIRNFYKSIKQTLIIQSDGIQSLVNSVNKTLEIMQTDISIIKQNQNKTTQQETRIDDLHKLVDTVQNGLAILEAYHDTLTDFVDNNTMSIVNTHEAILALKADVTEGKTKYRKVDAWTQQMNVTVENCCKNAGEYSSLLYIHLYIQKRKSKIQDFISANE